MKILMSAYACEPDKGSEPAVGWNWALQAAKQQEVWVLTRINNGPSIETYLAENPIPTLHFVYHDLPKWARFWKRGSHGVHLYYRLWQVTAVPKARRLHREHNFDVGHHITLVSLRHPSFLAWLKIPYIWGPVGGGERAPMRMYKIYGFMEKIRELGRDMSNLVARLDPMVRLTVRHASLIVAATPASAKSVSRKALPKIRIMPAIGIDTRPLDNNRSEAGAGPLRLIYVGRLVHWKGVQLAIKALAKVAQLGVEAELTIVGNGPYRRTLGQMVSHYNLFDRVVFTGDLPYEDVKTLYGRHDALIFPSFHDSGGFVVLEAMASGLPVICLDVGGPAMAVTDDVGIRIPVRSVEQVILDLSAAIQTMAKDAERRECMGQAGRYRARDAYGWERIGMFLQRTYQDIASDADQSQMCPESFSNIKARQRPNVLEKQDASS